MQTNLTIHSLSISGIMVTLGLFFTATKMAKKLLFYMYMDLAAVRKQQICELDLSKHIKDD